MNTSIALGFNRGFIIKKKFKLNEQLKPFEKKLFLFLNDYFIAFSFATIGNPYKVNTVV